MMRTLFGRTLYEKRWFIAGWATVFGVISTLVLMFYPSFSQEGGIEDVAASLPSQLQGFIGDPSVFKSIDGFIALQIYDVRMSLLLIIMSIVLAIGLTIREEESGTLRTTLNTSIGRTRLVMEKVLAGVAIVCLLNLVSTIGIYIGLASLGLDASHTLLWQLFALSCLFGVTALSIPLGVALATGKRGLTLTAGLVVALGSYILSTFARAVEWLQPWDHLSLMSYYDTASIRSGSFDTLDAVVLGLITLVMLTVGTLLFRSRDIA